MHSPETQFCPIDFELAYVMSEPAVFKPQSQLRWPATETCKATEASQLWTAESGYFSTGADNYHIDEE